MKEPHRSKMSRELKSYLADAVLESPKNVKRLREHIQSLKLAKLQQADIRSGALGKSAGWLARLATKGFDLVQGPALAELGWQSIKRNQRRLNPLEAEESRLVFGESLPLYKIKIDENSLIARAGAKFAGASNMGVTTFYTVNFTRKLKCAKGNRDMAWLIHELVHVAQMQQVGSQYTIEALHAQFTDGYSYGGPKALKSKDFCDFNREQQAMIIEDYYRYVLQNRKHRRYGKLPAQLYEEKVEEMKRGDL